MKRGARTRERILDAAASLMRSHGLANVTTREIARTAGLSEAAMYRHFVNKDQLVGAVLAERLPEFIDVLKNLPSRVGQGPLQDTLEQLASAAVAYFAELVPMIAPIFSEPALLAGHQAAIRESGLGPQLANQALAAYLRAEQELGRVRSDVSPDAGASLLLGACFQRGFFQGFLGEHVALLPASPGFARDLAHALVRGLSA